MTIIKKFEPTVENQQNWKHKKITILFGFFLISLIIAEIWVANTMANFGEKFENIQGLQKSIEQENQLLENEVEEQLSLQNIASSSAALGLNTPKSVKYIR